MKIQKIQSYITPKTTGYAATTTIGLAVYAGISKNKSFNKSHKLFAWLSMGLVALHIGLIEYYHHKIRDN